MDMQYYGANCLVLTTKRARMSVDDNLADLGSKSVTKSGDIALFTSTHTEPPHMPKLIIDQPGEYEVSGVSVYGIAARGFLEDATSKSATIYKIVFDEMRVLVTGHIFPELSDAQLEAIGTVDVLCVPVGGNSYTLDSAGALKLIKKIEPKIVIPTHYKSKKVHYPVEQLTLEEALQAFAMEPKETTDKLKLKLSDVSDTLQIVVLKEV